MTNNFIGIAAIVIVIMSITVVFIVIANDYH